MNKPYIAHVGSLCRVVKGLEKPYIFLFPEKNFVTSFFLDKIIFFLLFYLIILVILEYLK